MLRYSPIGDRELSQILQAVKSYLALERESGVEEHFLKGVIKKESLGGRLSSDLESLKREVRNCTRCDLHATRRNVVFGSGNPKARVLFIGEAPGEEEDIQAMPFVGRAGQLLTKIIEAIGLKRQDVYIANILKCRPPNNRMPLPTEILACEENIQRQIEIIKPKVICTLGKFASQTLLKTQVPISSLRGKFQDYNGIKVMPTFHPAYLLRYPQDKRKVWEEMKKVMKELK
ncbi:MAG: uracil-DNA glycosylase [Candidatus Omnitrophica bacterium]|nr:uracil-DNA glycosylase [Candidatus Omnitrophota bacterium]